MQTATRKPVILVTGSNQRTGKAVAMDLASDADTVIVCARSGNQLDAVVEALVAKGCKSYALTVDVTHPESVSSCVDEIIQRSGRLDVLVNNVGEILEKPLLETSLEEWNAVLNSNLASVFLMSKAVLPHMIANNFGRIINMTDAKAQELKAAPNYTAYKIAKTGLVILTKSLAKVCGEYDITVNSLAPGVLENSVIKPDLSRIPKNRFG